MSLVAVMIIATSQVSQTTSRELILWSSSRHLNVDHFLVDSWGGYSGTFGETTVSRCLALRSYFLCLRRYRDSSTGWRGAWRFLQISWRLLFCRERQAQLIVPSRQAWDSEESKESNTIDYFCLKHEDVILLSSELEWEGWLPMLWTVHVADLLMWDG